MGFIKNRKAFAIAVLLTIIFFASRLIFLTHLPIFTDEAIYIRWAQIAYNDYNWLFISLTDGKQPLFIWFIVIILHIVKDPLLAGRLVSVFAGLTSMIGLFLLSKELFKDSKIAFLSALVYIIYPFALVYDRMALYDSLVETFAIYGLYLVIRLARKNNLVSAIVLGLEVGLSNLNKSNFFQTIILAFPTLLVFRWGENKYFKKISKPFLFVILAGVISYAMYSSLRISPFFYIINLKNAVFIYPIGEWLSHPFLAFPGNIKALLVWFYDYTTLPLIVLMIAGLFVDKKFIREKIVLLLWFTVPVIALSFLGRVIYPRYILFMALPLLLLVAYSLNKIFEFTKNRLLFALIAIVFLILPLKSDFYILTDFSKSDVPFTDKFQYDAGWPSGWGVKEAVSFFGKQSERGKIFVGTQGTFGLLPYSLDIYLGKNKNVVTKGYWPINDQIPEDLLAKAKSMPTYVVFYQPCSSCREAGVPPVAWPLKKVFSVNREEVNFGVYQVESNQ